MKDKHTELFLFSNQAAVLEKKTCILFLLLFCCCCVSVATEVEILYSYS